MTHFTFKASYIQSYDPILDHSRMLINWPRATGSLRMLSGAVKSPVKDTFQNSKLKPNFALQISHTETERGNISICGLEAH